MTGVLGKTGETNLAATLLAGLQSHPDAALSFHAPGATNQIMASALASQALDLAAGLESIGVRASQVVAVQLPHCVENAVTLHALWFIGAVVVPVSPLAGAAELASVAHTAGAVAVVMPASWRDIDWAARTRDLVKVGIVPATRVVTVGGQGESAAIAYEDLMRVGRWERPEVGGRGPVAMVFSSGSTSRPKGVIHTSASLVAAARAWNERLGIDEQAVSLNFLPPGHIGGLSTFVRIALSGCDSDFLERWDPRATLDLVARRGPVVMSGTPLHLAALLDEASAEPSMLTNIRTFVVGAARVDPALLERSDKAGVTAVRSYGSSEHPIATMGDPMDPLEVRKSTDGSPIGGTRVRIRAADGRVLGPGQQGEIELKGPQQFLGYLDPLLDGRVFTEDGWYRTGDSGTVDAGGRLTVYGRLDDVVIRGGENISVTEVEQVLARSPAIALAAATGVPDERYGERVAAVVVLAPGTSLDVKDLRDLFEATGVSMHKTPEHLIIVEELPTTETGKIDKAALRRLAQEQVHVGQSESRVRGLSRPDA